MRKRNEKGQYKNNIFLDVKECSRCKVEKKIIDFSKESRNLSGYGAMCKICKQELARE